jgi:hypothetical protein
LTKARASFKALLAERGPMGLLSEDLDPNNGRLWGNFLQTHPMVGIINCAMLLSKPWGLAVYRFEPGSVVHTLIGHRENPGHAEASYDRARRLASLLPAHARGNPLRPRLTSRRVPVQGFPCT